MAGNSYVSYLQRGKKLHRQLVTEINGKKYARDIDRHGRRAKLKLSKGFFGLARALPALGLIMLLGAVFGAMES